MPRRTGVIPALLQRYPDLWSQPQEEIDRLLEEESGQYDRDIAAPAQIPGQDPEEALRAALPEEEAPVTAGLRVQESEAPERLGAFTAESPLYKEIQAKQLAGEVSDEQALRWEEERRIYDAPYKISGELRKGRDYRQELIDKQFDGIDPNVRDVKKHAALEMTEAKKQFEEILGRTPNTPEERLASFNFQQKAKQEAYAQKQKDIETLNNAVSKYNTEQVVPAIKSIQAEAAMLQEKHAAQAQAETEARAGIEEEIIRARTKKEKDLDRTKDQLFKKRVQLEKFKEPPSEDLIKAYNKIARKAGEPEIQITKEAKQRFEWWKPWTWFGGEEEAMGEEVRKPIRRKWNPQTGRLES